VCMCGMCVRMRVCMYLQTESPTANNNDGWIKRRMCVSCACVVLVCVLVCWCVGSVRGVVCLLQCVAVFCVVVCVFVEYRSLFAWCTVVHCGALWCSVLQCVAVCCSVFQCVAVCCSVLQCVALCVYVGVLYARVCRCVHARVRRCVCVCVFVCAYVDIHV